MSFRRGVALVSLAALAVGCTSISGHRIAKDSANKVTVQDVKGVPIVIQTPTRALFVLTTSEYELARVETTFDKNAKAVTVKTPLGHSREQVLSEKPVFLGPSEVYTIDPKRPLAGSIDYTIELEQQQLKKIAGKLDDKTLEELRQLASDLADMALKAAAPTAGVTKQAGEAALVERTLVGTTLSLVIVDLATGGIDIQQL